MSPADAGDRLGAIDLHAHYVSPEVIAEARRAGQRYGVRVESIDSGRERLVFVGGPTIRPFFPELSDLKQRLPWLDARGIERQVLSTWTDLCGYHLPTDQGRRWVRLQNETLAEDARRFPERFEAMGTLPMQDPLATLEEMDYAVRELGVRAFEVGTSVNGRDLDHDTFRPFWRRALELDVLIFLHPPIQQIGFDRLGTFFLNNLIGNPVETTVAAARLILSGVLDEFPGLRILLAHGGGFLPYQVGRLDRGHAALESCRIYSQAPPSVFLQRFFYDTILFDPHALRYLLDTVGRERVVLGTDYPFEMRDDDIRTRIEAATKGDPETQRAILWDNAVTALSRRSTAAE